MKHALIWRAGRSRCPHAAPAGLVNSRAVWAAALLALVLGSPSNGQQPQDGAGYVGARACGSCHRTQFEKQSATGHANTLHRASEHPLQNRFAPAQPLLRAPGFRFRYRRDGDDLTVLADDNEYVMELPVEWAFGAGNHGVTFVSRLNRQSYLEHAYSYYSEAEALDITTGHESVRPETLLQAMGLRYAVRGEGNSISDCFECHSTGPLAYTPRSEIQISEAGVRCESCHGPGIAHLEAVAEGDLALARSSIGNPSRLSADRLLQFCGDCHRDPRGASSEFDFQFAWNVRHQPPFFRQSKCFEASGGQLSCLGCHDPHETLRRGDPDHYRERCMACHLEVGKQPARACGAEAAPDCTACHMPTVEVSPHLSFKNHWIGVYANGNVLRPAE